MAAVLLFIPGPETRAACPPGTRLRVRPVLRDKVSTGPERAVNEGGVSVPLSFTRPLGETSLSVSAAGVSHETTVSPRRWLWMLRVPRPTSLASTDLLITYHITGADGASGVLTSATSPDSRVAAKADTRQITETRRGRWVIFRGFADIHLDYANATRSGPYNGMLTVTVDCR